MTEKSFFDYKNIDARAALCASRLDQSKPDEPSLRVAFHAAAINLVGTQAIGLDGNPIPGVQAYYIAGAIYTATVSLNGLKALADDTRVSYIEGARPLGPA